MSDENQPGRDEPTNEPADQGEVQQPETQPARPAGERPGGEDPTEQIDAAQASVNEAMETGPTGDADDEAALEQASETVSQTQAETASVMGATDQPIADQPSAFDAPSFDPTPPTAPDAEIQLLGDVNVDVRIELGRTRMLVEDVLRLSEGAVVELEKLAGDPVDVFVNGRHVAKGEVLVLNENFCVRVNEVIEPLPVSES